MWSSYNVGNSSAYKMQYVHNFLTVEGFDLGLKYIDCRTVMTILGPTPLLAANFVIFGVVIRQLGSLYSRF